jgi:hypothetical protein
MAAFDDSFIGRHWETRSTRHFKAAAIAPNEKVQV